MSENPNPASRARLLSPDEYLKRFTAAEASLQKSLLMLIALAAFWLGIENSYVSYENISNASEQAKESTEIRVRQIEAIKGVLKQKTGQTDNDLLLRADKAAAENAGLALAREAELKQQVANLKEEPVELAIVGTKITSRLGYASVIWLFALLAWMGYFLSVRGRALRNLAAFCLATDEQDRRFGCAGDGGFCLAPLPKSLNLDGSNLTQRMEAPKPEILQVLGWTENTEQRYRLLSYVLAALVLLLAVRNAFLVFKVTNDFALQQLFATEYYATALAFAAIILTALIIWQMWSWLLAGKSIGVNIRVGRDMRLSRRSWIAAGITGAIFVALIRNGVSLAPGKITFGGNTARFIAADKKRKRLTNYRVIAKGAAVSSLMVSERRRDSAWMPVTLHFANEDGTVRLFSAARSIAKLRPVSEAEATAWFAAGSDQQSFQLRSEAAPRPLSGDRTTAWEAAALAKVSAGDIPTACTLLLAGFALSRKKKPTGNPNYRLIDLAAGLAVRYGLAEQFSGQLAAALPEGDVGGRAKKWADTNSKWRKRWTNRESPITWHHPLKIQDGLLSSMMARQARQVAVAIP